MYITCLAYTTSLITLLALDSLWLIFFMRSFYNYHLGHLLAPSFSLTPVIFFYLMYPLGINILVVLPHSEKPLATTIALGACLGFIAYGTYDFTNHATLKNWPLIVTLIDLAWGTLVTACVTAVTLLVLKSLR